MLLICCLFFLQVSWSQDTTYMLKVKKPKSELFVSYQDTFLVKGNSYYFTIKFKEGKKRVTRILSDSIILKRVKKDVYLVHVKRHSRITRGLIRIYVQNEDGSKQLFKILDYRVVEPEMPKIFVGNIKADSVIDKRYLYDYAKLNAVYKGTKVKITSFKFCFVMDGLEDTLVSGNSSLTQEMKRKIQRLRPGSTIYFRDITCQLPSGKTEVVKSIRLFFDRTNKYLVGERIIYKN